MHLRTADLERYREARERLRSTLAAVLAGRLRMQDIPDGPDIVLIQDHIVQMGQGAAADRRSERLGRSDSGIALLRKLWSRGLRSLAAGRSLTSWVVPPGLLATTGL